MVNRAQLGDNVCRGQERIERSNPMDIGALEYVVIGVSNDRFTQVIRPELHAIAQTGRKLVML
jgi:hypothetical protein